MQGGLSGVWFVVTNYRELRDGTIRIEQKHQLPPTDAQVLDDLVESRDLARRALEALEELDLHGPSRAGRVRKALRDHFAEEQS